MLIERQKKILLILIENKKWHTFLEIANKIDCSTKTIQRDLILLKEVIPSQWYLEVFKGKGVRLFKPSDSSIGELSCLFIRADISFQIINEIFHGNVQTITSIAENLYTSIPSIYSHLKEIEKYLDSFGLTLKRRPLSISGDPSYIIFMYQEFFMQSYSDHEWPFKSDEANIHQYAVQIEGALNITLYPIYKRRLIYIISILIEQKEQGRLLQINSDLINKVRDTPFYKIISHLNQNKFKHYFTKEELTLLTISINCSKYIHKNLLLYKHEILHHFHQGNVIIYNHIKDLIFSFEQKFQHHFMENPDFVFAVIQYLKYTLSKYRFFPHMKMPEDNQVSCIKIRYSKTFKEVGSIYNEWVKKYNLQTFISDDEIATLSLHIEGALMLEKPLCVKILLLIEDGEKWILYIKGLLNQKFGNIFDFIYKDINDLNYNTLDIDLIITTFTNIQSTIPIIRISTIPTNREIHDIKNFIYKNSFISD
ncbi:helix-turn-helix domain-containing protein [Bacillus thuringiensis]|uniref:helix-turn-helix domain-containing protein n=1 Tax=Bacillus thuringiensis TaxID=1428 RepID=UPI003D01B53B